MAEPTTPRLLQTERVSLRAWLGVVLLFIVFGLLVAVLIGASPRGTDYEAKRATEREQKLKQVREEAQKDLHSYAWVDKSKGVARIPIERAMQLTLTELAQKKPAPANPIESPSPPAGQPTGAVPAASPQSPATETGKAAASPAVSTPSPTGTAKPKFPSVEGPSNPEIRGQPAGAANPPGAAPGTQPGPSATPAAAPSPPSGKPPASPATTPKQSPPGTPLPAAGATPP